MFDLFLSVLVLAGVVYLVKLGLDYKKSRGGGRRGDNQKRR